MALRVSVAVADLVASATEVAVFCTVKGAPLLVALGGSVALTITLYVAPAATGPVSGAPSPLVSVNGVTPSLLNSCNVVPAGKVLVPVATLKVRLAPWRTVNGTVFEDPGTVVPAPLL